MDKNKILSGERASSEVTEQKTEEEHALNEVIKLPLAYQEKRHHEEILGSNSVTQTWRLKERVRWCLCSPTHFLTLERGISSCE